MAVRLQEGFASCFSKARLSLDDPSYVMSVRPSRRSVGACCRILRLTFSTVFAVSPAGVIVALTFPWPAATRRDGRPDVIIAAVDAVLQEAREAFNSPCFEILSSLPSCTCLLRGVKSHVRTVLQSAIFLPSPGKRKSLPPFFCCPSIHRSDGMVEISKRCFDIAFSDLLLRSLA